MHRLAITGIGQTAWRRRHVDRSAGELMFEAASIALADAGLRLADVDASVLGVAPDGLSGVNCPEKSSFFIPPGRPAIRINTGGTTGADAFAQAMLLVRSGQARNVLVVALERMGQATTSQAVFNTIFDPIYEKDIALSTVTMAAMRASKLMHAYGYTADHWARIAARNYAQALDNPYAHVRRAISVDDVKASKMLAWPIRLYEGCPMSEGACAVVVSARPGADAAWIRGTGSYTDTYAMGDRMRRKEGSLVDLLTLRLAAADAYREAGIAEPARQVRLIELQAPFASAEAMAYQALGLCTPQDGPAFAEASVAADPEIVVNPSGGPQAANPVSATALVRILECAAQVRGQAGERQVDGADWAVATAQGGASQFSMATVLSSRAQ
jgi:acetyl-CoA C-acetyltransferase